MANESVPTRILTAEEVGEVLRLPTSTLQDLARRRHSAVPQGFKVGRAWRWRAEDVEAFVSSRGERVSAS